MAPYEKNTVAWNIASAQSQQISNLLNRATEQYLKGDLGSWFWTLSAARESVNHELDKNVQEALDTLEADCNKYSSSWFNWKNNLSLGTTNGNHKEGKAKYSKNIRKYQRKLMQELKVLGFFPNKEDRSRMSF